MGIAGGDRETKGMMTSALAAMMASSSCSLDAADDLLLCKARVDRAKYLIAICGDDGANVEITVQACQWKC